MKQTTIRCIRECMERELSHLQRMQKLLPECMFPEKAETLVEISWINDALQDFNTYVNGTNEN